MEHMDLDAFLSVGRGALARGPVALIFAEDAAEVESTLRHHLRLGFRAVVMLAPPGLDVPPALSDAVHRVGHDVFAEGAVTDAVNRIAAAAPGVWFYYGYNAEYLFFPFCEHRRIGEMLAFHEEERREAMLCYVVDLYAGDLAAHPDAVDPGDAHLDRSGYYALARPDPARPGQKLDRQYDFFGGLHWRFEEHIPAHRRRIDRIALFRARPDARLTAADTFTLAEMNTYACPWHHNLTAAVCSFRAAKALRTNPGSRHDIDGFRWHNSVRFDWNSQQLMDLGLMEPGQWF